MTIATLERWWNLREWQLGWQDYAGYRWWHVGPVAVCFGGDA